MILMHFERPLFQFFKDQWSAKFSKYKLLQRMITALTNPKTQIE